jgi:dTDP-4-dehydrorhamnose reductase
MRLLITGASGLLGLNLALAVREDHHVIGVDRCALTGVPFEQICLDLLDSGAAERVLDEAHPDAVIHCAALANLDACEAEPDLAFHLNAELPGTLAAACARRGVRMLQVSTDSVFDGTSDGIYTESDTPNPQGVYSTTKLQGEQNVLSTHPQSVVARVNFFGWSLSGSRSIAEFFYNVLSKGQSCNGFKDVWFCPMFVGDLAETLVRMLEFELSGLYHAVGSDVLTKYEFGVRLAEKFGFDSTLIHPISVEESGLKARRSPKLHLSVHKLSTAFGTPVPGLSTGLEKFYTQFQQEYPQKIRSYAQG